MGQSLQRILEEFPLDEPIRALPTVRRLRPQSDPPPLSEQSIKQAEVAYARGYDEGQAVLREAMQAQLDAAQEEYQQSVKLATSRFSEQVAAELTEGLHAKLDALQAEIANQIAAALLPVVVYALNEATVRELVAGLKTLAADSGTITVELCGPQELIDAVWNRYCEIEPPVPGNSPMVKFVLDETQEVRVSVNDAVIEGRLKEWISKLMDAVR